MNEIHGLWMHHSENNPFQDIDAFHCFDCDGEEACLYCPHCGVAERYEIMCRVHQHYKGGFEVWKDWDDVKEVYNEQ